MRWFIPVLFVAVIAIVIAEPEPKKYKPETKTKEKESASLTDEEKTFLREVEAKFGIKTDVPIEKDDNEEEKVVVDDEDTETTEGQIKTPFPAVIAIEIVNDTDDKDTPSKGKRTIDANLGYGYQTNNGYTYTYFGKQPQQKPKFMIYPYSQHDIPPANTNAHSSGYSYSSPQSSQSHSVFPAVEIMPSNAYELIPTKEEPVTYTYEKPSIEFKTKYEDAQSVEQPPPAYPTSETPSHQATPQTFYTTYNGQQLSGLSGKFPSVMSNYLVDSSQLLKSPQYQSAGITQDYLQAHGDQQERKVVPVLVLRVPSSYLKKPTAELYADAPHSVSQYLNVNLQELVNQYFRKLGYSHAPQVMAYQSSSLAHEAETPTSAPVASYETHNYASPYVQPSYTHADQAGVQYSAVQPVMARYPSSYSRPQYYVTRGQQYQQPQQQQPQYMYRYRYVPQTSAQPQPQPQSNYYSQSQAHYQQAYEMAIQQAYNQQYSQPQSSADQATSHEASSGHEHAANSYSAQQPETSQEEQVTSVEYGRPEANTAAHTQEYQQQAVNYEAPAATPQYETQTESSAEYGPTKVSIPAQEDSQSVQEHYEQPQQPIEVYPRGQAGHSQPESDHSQGYYQSQANSHAHAAHAAQASDDTLPLSENYPSKDHTIATVLPLSFMGKSRNPTPQTVQSVSYVTPMPGPMKYHAQYRVMVPQTVLRRPTEGKISYVNSHAAPNSYALQSSRYNGGRQMQYSSVTRQRPSHYPWNYHAHPKRMVRPESKSDAPSKKVITSENSSS